MRENLSSGGRILDSGGEIAARERASGQGDLFVAARVVQVSVGIDNVANRLVGNRLDRCQDLFAILREACVHQKHASVRHRHRDIAAGPDQHVHIATNLQGVHFRIGGAWALLGKTRRCRQQNGYG